MSGGHPHERPTRGHQGAAAGIHRHEHEHGDEVHRHPHHHAASRVRAHGHEHGHGVGFERLTYLVSPVHALDPRAKIVATVCLVGVIALTPPPRFLEFALLVTFLLAAARLGRLPLGAVLARASLVLPFAAALALFAPVARGSRPLSPGAFLTAYGEGGWIAAWSVMARAWLSALAVTVLAATTPLPGLIRGLETLRVPRVFVALFSFLSRYVGLFRAQLHSLRIALDSRAPSLSRARRARVYGNLAGNMLVRAYDRGERIHAAMLSRGFDGSLPSAEPLRVRVFDAVMMLVVALVATAVVLY